MSATNKEQPTDANGRARLEAVLAGLDRLEGTGDPELDACAVMKLTRDR